MRVLLPTCAFAFAVMPFVQLPVLATEDERSTLTLVVGVKPAAPS
jgi:hypothetical protein